MSGNTHIQPITSLVKAYERGKLDMNLLRQFDMDLQLLYDKIVELEERLEAIGG